MVWDGCVVGVPAAGAAEDGCVLTVDGGGVAIDDAGGRMGVVAVDARALLVRVRRWTARAACERRSDLLTRRVRGVVGRGRAAGSRAMGGGRADRYYPWTGLRRWVGLMAAGKDRARHDEQRGDDRCAGGGNRAARRHPARGQRGARTRRRCRGGRRSAIRVGASGAQLGDRAVPDRALGQLGRPQLLGGLLPQGRVGRGRRVAAAQGYYAREVFVLLGAWGDVARRR